VNEDEQMTAIQRVLDGETEIFGALVGHFQASVLRMAAAITGDAAAAPDLAQESFVSAYRHLKDYDANRATFAAWLHAIVRNRSRNFLRQRKAKPSVSGDDIYQICPRSSPDESLHWQEELGALDKALYELPENWRRAFSLTEIDGISYAEAAVMEGVPIGTIRSRVSRSRQILLNVLNNPFKNQVHS
jgi:RNA polymerase sigma-70 factor, ECF subfamily